MMTGISVTKIKGTNIEAQDGSEKTVIGDGTVVVGDVLWSLGDYVFCPCQKGGRPPIIWDESIGEMVVAYEDGTYDVRDAKNFEVKFSGTLQYWPADLLATATAGAKTWFAYNREGAFVLLVAVGLTDESGTKYSTYVGINLLTGNEIFRVDGFYHGNGKGFCMEVVDGETLEWAAAWLVEKENPNDAEVPLLNVVTRKYTNDQYAESTGTGEELDMPEESAAMDQSISLMNSSTTISDAISGRGGEDSGEKFAVLYPLTEPIVSNLAGPTCTTEGAYAVSSIGEAELTDVPAQLSDLLAANPLSGEILLGAVAGKKVERNISTTVYGGTVSAILGGEADQRFEGEVTAKPAIRAAMDTRENVLGYFGTECAWLLINDPGISLQEPDAGAQTYEGDEPYVQVVEGELSATMDVEGNLIAQREPYSDPATTTWCYVSLYKKSADGLKWVLQGKTLAGALDRSAESQEIPLPQSVFPWRQGMPIGVKPRVRYTSSDYDYVHGAQAQFTINGSVAYEATAQVKFTGKCSVGDMKIGAWIYRPGFKAKPRYFLSGYSTWGEVSSEAVGGTLYRNNFEVFAAFTFGGIYHDFLLLSETPGEGSVCDPAAEEVIFNGEAVGDEVSMKLPYQSCDSVLGIVVNTESPEGSLTVDETYLNEKFDKEKAYAVGDLNLGPVVLTGSNLYMPDEDGSLQKGALIEEAALTGTTINVQLPTLTKKMSADILGDAKEG